MKKLLTFALFCYTLTIISCSKSLNEPPVTSDGASKNETNAARLSTSSSLTDILTGPTWVYYEYFKNFTSNPANLVWKTNRSNNSLNLAQNKVKYYPDGTYTETDQYGTVYNGTWIFLNNDTKVQVTSPAGTFTSTIQQLTSNRYEWLDSASGHYGFMIPQNQVIDTTGGKLQLLTSQPWVYTEYFSGFSQSIPSLVWKPNKANSPLNLAQNWVKFNTNGTYTEIDQNGVTYNGSWQFMNNDTQVQSTSSQGTFTSTIKVLSTDRYEWLSTNGSAYGEMEHPAQ